MRLAAWLGVWIVGACGGTSAPPPPLVETTVPGDDAPTASTAPTAPTTTFDTGGSLLTWPVAPFTTEQREAVNTCNVHDLQRQYAQVPKGLVPDRAELTTACEQAVWAAECAARASGAECITEYRTAIASNPAFAVQRDLVQPFWGATTIVASPPVDAIIGAKVDYKWQGWGSKAWTVELAFPEHAVTVTGKTAPATVAWSPALDTFQQQLASGLRNFVPVPVPVQVRRCTDNYPWWDLTLELADHRKLALTTNGAAILGYGGPWQLIDHGQNYVQVGPDLLTAMRTLTAALALAVGPDNTPDGCGTFDFQAAALPP